MKKALALAVVCVLGWRAYTRYQAHVAAERPPAPPPSASRPLLPELPPDPAETTAAPRVMPVIPPARPLTEYSCDGRTYCSQMTSCDEAKYFLAHCPGVKMDGDGDGIPCERQWCGGG